MLSIQRVPLDSLHLDPSNARTHPDENLDAIAASLKRFGQAEPLVVQKSTGRVIGGNGRLAVMKKLGWTEADVVELDLDDLQATALGIALNRTGELATWDDATLAKLLQELAAEDSLDGVGYSTADIDKLLAEIEGTLPPKDLEDEGPEPPPPVATTRPGDLWLLGEHRLLCGDSTKAEDVLRLMAGLKAAMTATDPPYLVEYSGERPNDAGKDWSQVYKEIEIKDADGFFRSVFKNILEVLAPNAAIYCWHAHKRQRLITTIWEELGILDHQQLLWVKPTAVFGRSYWHFRHEPCLMGWRRGSQPPHDGRHDHDSVWEVDWQGKARVVGNEHPTMKPIELFARPMRKHTKRGDLCFEPFSGSGSQIMAAEQEGRRCYALEISAPFVDAAIRRWEKATGKQATLETTGQTFAQVATARKEEP